LNADGLVPPFAAEEWAYRFLGAAAGDLVPAAEPSSVND
jgi:hypothetical protein